jgi:hypothetical protein
MQNLGKKQFFLLALLKTTDEKSRIRFLNPVYGSKVPDPSQNVTDPEHCKKVHQNALDEPAFDL